MELNSYFEIWLSIKAKEFLNSYFISYSGLLDEDSEDYSYFISDSGLVDEDIMIFLDSNSGLAETFSRQLGFSNVFEKLKEKIEEKIEEKNCQSCPPY